MNIQDTLDSEIKSLSHLLASVPFDPKPSHKQKFFLNVYKLNYNQVAALGRDDEGGLAHKFPINSNKLLKLGISLGNLIKSLQLDEQMASSQQPFVGSITTKKITPNSSVDDPFLDDASRASTRLQLAPYQLKFVSNLAGLLKNFDIGVQTYRPDLAASQSNLTLNQYNTPTNGSTHSNPSVNGSLSGTNASPIRLNSKQLLVEKLEINISLDTLFIYKIVLKLVIDIYAIIKDHLAKANVGPHFVKPTIDRDDFESASIFSYNSMTSAPEHLSVEEYYRALKQAVTRINAGLVDPFIRLVLAEIVEPNIQNDFSNLINNM